MGYDERRASEFFQEALKQIKTYKEQNKEMTKFVQRGIYDKFFRAGQIYQEIGSFEKAEQCYDLAWKYAPYEDSRAQISEAINSLDKAKLQKRSGLEKKVFSIMAIVTLLTSLFFISADLTGHVISNPLTNDMKWVGLCFFICGLIFTLISIRGKHFSKDL